MDTLDPPAGSPLSRRLFLGAAAAGVASLGGPALAAPRGLVAVPPAGFVPLSLPGKVVKVARGNTLQANGLFPTEEAASALLQRAMEELTGLADVGRAFARVVHPADRVAIKPNGIAGKIAANRELLLAIVRGVVAAGVPAGNIVIYEQRRRGLAGTRCVDAAGVLDPAFPPGVRTMVHDNTDAVMPEIQVNGIATRFVRPLTEATAIINVGVIKDHARAGYTGCLKNLTHGSTVNPHDFHEHHLSPQIASLYAQDVVRSRVRLHLVDGFKLLYDGGPLDNPARRVPHEAVYAATDPVALDVVGWAAVEEHRKNGGLPTLAEAGREPAYLQVASALGLGIADRNRIRLREVRL